MMTDKFISTTEAAKLLGISRIAVFNRIKAGVLPAHKVGRNYIIDKNRLSVIQGHKLTTNNRQEIEAAVKKTVRDYAETLRLLGRE